MFIKKTRNNKGQVYFHLVESFRSDGKVKQRVLFSLGREEEGKIKQLAAAINRHSESLQAIEQAKSLDVKHAYIAGPLLILERVMRDLGINEITRRIALKHERLGFDLLRTLFTLIASRWIKPVSKLELYEKWVDRLYPELVDNNIQLHQFYRCLDVLAKHKEEIENFLYGYDRDLFSMQTDVVLYDLTTLRFESTREDTDSLRKFGYSKEHRNDCTQVVLGLLTDTDGIPLSFEVHPGNTFEGHTLKGIVDKMRNKFQIRRFIFVADRGLFSSDNLTYIKEQKGEFVVGMRLGKLQKPTDSFYEIKKYKWINDGLAFYETTYKGDRLIITWAKARADKDRKTREEVLEKIKKKLSSSRVTAKQFITQKPFKKYILIDGKKPILNQKVITEEEKKDGFFGIITNVKDLKPEQIVNQYKALWHIEDAFGELKGNLKVRPIFHWTNERIIGHLTVCFLAYLCQAYLTKKLRQKKVPLKSKAIKENQIRDRALTAPTAIEELAGLLAIPIETPSKKIWIRTDIGQNGVQLFKMLGMPIPPKILKTEPKM
jgi:transposase